MKIFSDLLALMEEIDGLYIKLYKLECLGEINSGYFFDVVTVLKNKIDRERQLFDEFVNCSDYSEIKEYLEDEKGPVFLRFKEYIKLYDELNIDADNEEERMLTLGFRTLYKSCYKNLFLLYFSLFQEYIETIDYPLLKERMLALKYYHAFTKLDLGEILIENDFHVARENYIDLYLVVDSVKIGEYDNYAILLESQLEVILDMLKQFLTISDEQYKDYNMIAASKGIEFLIRACLSMLSTKDYENIKDNIFMVIDELSNDKNTKVVDIVENILENRMLDKARVRKLSFRPLED